MGGVCVHVGVEGVCVHVSVGGVCVCMWERYVGEVSAYEFP